MNDDLPTTREQAVVARPLISRGTRKLIEAAAAIRGEPDVLQAEALGFSTRVLVQAGLPHSNPSGNPPAWVRTNGNFSLVVQPRVLPSGESTGYPYGSIPRLILAYICSEVVKTKSREVVLGRSLADFMRALGLWNTGGVRGDITRVKEQLFRLVNCNIHFYYDKARDEHLMASSAQSIADDYCFWWDRADPQQLSLKNSVIVLTERFHREILDHPVPLDMRILEALKSSALALDLYTWLTYRVFGLAKPQEISWAALQKQMGSDYANSRDFKRKIKELLKRIRALWPALNLAEVDGGLRLLPSRPSVAGRTVTSALPDGHG